MAGKRRADRPLSGCLIGLLLCLGNAQASEVFQWRDAQGRLHFGDQPPAAIAADNLSEHYASTALPFAVHIQGIDYPVPVELSQKIELAISKTFSILKQSLNLDYQDARDFRVVIYGDEQAFRRYQQAIAPILHQAAGFYSRRDHQITTYNLGHLPSLLSLLTHEAVHAMLGSAQVQVPIWLNEGLAEYSANLQLHGFSADIPLDTRTLNLLHHQPLSEARHRHLLDASQPQWLASNGPHGYAYAASEATVFFLLDRELGKQFMHQMLIQQQQKPTSTLINQHWPGGFSAFHADFTQWLERSRRHPPKHRY